MTSIYTPSRKNLPIVENRIIANDLAAHKDQSDFQRLMNNKNNQNIKSDEKSSIQDNNALGRTNKDANSFKQADNHNQLLNRFSLDKKSIENEMLINDEKQTASKNNEIEERDDKQRADQERLEGCDTVLSGRHQDTAFDSNRHSSSETLMHIEMLRQGDAPLISGAGAVAKHSPVSMNQFMAMFEQLEHAIESLPSGLSESKKWQFSLEDDGLPVVDLTVDYNADKGWAVHVSSDSEENLYVLEQYHNHLAARFETNKDQNVTISVMFGKG